MVDQDDASFGLQVDCLEQPKSHIEVQKQVPAHDATLPLSISNSNPQSVCFGGETPRVPTAKGEAPGAETDMGGSHARFKRLSQECGLASGSRPVEEEGLAQGQKQTPG